MVSGLRHDGTEVWLVMVVTGYDFLIFSLKLADRNTVRIYYQAEQRLLWQVFHYLLYDARIMLRCSPARFHDSETVQLGGLRPNARRRKALILQPRYNVKLAKQNYLPGGWKMFASASFATVAAANCSPCVELLTSSVRWQQVARNTN